MKSKLIAYILWFFLGIFGAHKFYLHKWGMGIFYLFTGGFLLIGCLIDLFTLGSQVDTFNLAKANKKLQKETSKLAQNTVNLASQVATNQNMQYEEITANIASSVAHSESKNGDSKIEKLRNIKSLLDSGILTQEEFEAEKQKILNA